jgi:Redoxin.
MDYDPAERVRRLVARKALPYTIALDDGGAIADAFDNVRVTPTTVLIGADGRVIWQRIGKLDFERLGEEIAREIAKGNTA